MSLRSSLVLVVLSSACLTPSLSPCGDLLCADGAVCVADTVCASPEQLAACAGLEPETACQTSGGTGHCVTGVCVGNICGDGLVTGNEVCDGSEITVTCADFGFYGGDISCAPSCTANRDACSGQCGDGVVQTEFDEQCDTVPPIEGCLDFGQDYGVLTCNAFCAPAIQRDCQRYGWDQLLPASTTYAAAAANAHGVIGMHGSAIDVVWNGVASTRANPGWTSITSSENAVVLVGDTSIGWFDGTWHELPVGLPGASWLTLASDGQLFARVDVQCGIKKVDLATGDVVNLPAPPVGLCDQGIAFSGTALYIPQPTEGVRKWNGSQWVDVLTGPYSYLVRSGTHGFFAVQATTQRFVDVSTEPPTIGPSILAGPAGATVSDTDQNQLTAVVPEGEDDPDFSIRANTALFPIENLVAEGQRGITSSADGRILTFGSGVRAMRALAFGATFPVLAAISDVHRADDGLIACGSELLVSGLSGFAQRPYNSGGCLEVTGSALGAHYVVTAYNVLVAYNAGNNSYGQLIGNPVTSVAGDFTQLWSAGSALFSITNGSSATFAVETLPSGCTAVKLAMSPTRRFVGVGVCNGKLAVFDRVTAWNTLATSTIDALVTTPMEIAIGDDNVIFVRVNQDVYRLDGTTFALFGHGLRVEAVSANDVFIDQGGETMLHITGGRSQEIRLASGPFVATRTHLFSWDRINRRLLGIARMTNVPNGP